MRTTTALRAFAAAVLAGGALAVATAGPASANDGAVWGTVVSRTDLNLRDAPDIWASVVNTLPPGSEDRIDCATTGSTVNGNAWWYWFTDARGWGSAAYVDTGGRHVPNCDGDRHHSPRGGDREGNSPSGFYFRSDYRIEFGVTF